MWRGSALIAVLALPAGGTVRAQNQTPVVVTLTPGSVRIKIIEATLAQAIDALSKAGSFKVTYDGPRPADKLFNTEVVAPSVAEAVFRLLGGQNLNYGVVLDPSSRVTSVLMLGPAARTGGAPAVAASPTRPQALPTPRFPRTNPDADEQPERPEEPEQPESVPSPSPSASPAPPAVPNRPFNPSPFAPRPLTPYGTPPGARPTPAVSPSP